MSKWRGGTCFWRQSEEESKEERFSNKWVVVDWHKKCLASRLEIHWARGFMSC
jgi:hypothetical protein